VENGRTVREWTLRAEDREIEVAPGVVFPAWTFDGRIPGSTLRCTQGDLLRVRFVNRSEHPHAMHFHGVHPTDMDGVPMVGRGIIEPGEEFTYVFDAEPFGVDLYHCHVGPLAEHIARGMYGTFVVDPPAGRQPPTSWSWCSTATTRPSTARATSSTPSTASRSST
jgi:FtsP/CotA-like multicopper oxidase with cupredoxin domain